jgi:regulator of protease activity HflC (stomatin/prohibitin superfamily)
MVERFGNFTRQAGAGPNVICCPVEMMVGKVSLRVQQLEVRCETKTLDNVFVDVIISIQYEVNEGFSDPNDKLSSGVYKAFYELSDPKKQITAYVYDVVRSTIPLATLDQAFEDKETISLNIKKYLGDIMMSYGYTISNALVTDMTPDARVRNAMNEINASKRLKDAAKEKAEGNKVLTVKSAEAEAESKYLSGVGVARQRKAIVDGLRGSISQFSGNIKGTTPKDVVDLLLITQYFDMLKDIGSRPNCNTVYVPDCE